jgi:hypothetical protein
VAVIAMSPPDRTGLRRILLGTMAEAVLGRSIVPLLLAAGVSVR